MIYVEGVMQADSMRCDDDETTNEEFNEYEMEPTTKTYFITDTYENQFPIDFVYSKNRKYVVFQYCRAVGSFFLPPAGNGTHVCRYLGYLFRQCGEGGTFHCYHFHIQSFLLVSVAKFGNKPKGL